jgi:hypothetical protein
MTNEEAIEVLENIKANIGRVTPSGAHEIDAKALTHAIEHLKQFS